MPISRHIPISRRRLSIALAAGALVTATLGLATAAEAPTPKHRPTAWPKSAAEGQLEGDNTSQQGHLQF